MEDDSALDQAIMASPAGSAQGLVAGGPSARDAPATRGPTAGRQPIPANRMAIMRAIEEVNATERSRQRRTRALRIAACVLALLALVYLAGFAVWRSSGRRGEETTRRAPRSFRALDDALESEQRYFEIIGDGEMAVCVPRSRKRGEDGAKASLRTDASPGDIREHARSPRRKEKPAHRAQKPKKGAKPRVRAAVRNDMPRSIVPLSATITSIPTDDAALLSSV